MRVNIFTEEGRKGMRALDWFKSRRQTGENSEKSKAWQPRPTVHVVVGHGPHGGGGGPEGHGGTQSLSANVKE